MSIFSVDRHPKLFVWTVWLVMVFVAFICLVSYGRNIPMAEDWLMVPPLTGNEPNLGPWLWSQNNEHRIPLPRLIILAALKLTNGDFRSGMVLNVLTLALVAVVAILVIRYLRGGKTCYRDAFFPIILLNIGHWPNLFWIWQVCFVLPTALTYTLLFVFLIEPTLITPLAAAIAGVTLVSLPLCGANGLLFGPFIALWFIYRGFINLNTPESPEQQRWAGMISIASAVITLGLIGVYFIGYERPTWNPPSPGLAATLQTSAKFLAYSLGAFATFSWDFFIFIAFGIFIPTLALVISAVLRYQGFEKQRALAMLLFCGILSLFTLAMGYGRAGLIPSQGFPLRYVILAVPLLCTAFFIWELYGPQKWQKIVPWGLFLGMVLLLPLNMMTGFSRMGNWYDGVMDAVERDIDAGMSISEIAQRNGKSLVHWFTQEQLENHIQMLYEDRVGPFAKIQQKPTTP